MILRNLAITVAVVALSPIAVHAADKSSQDYPVWSDAPGFNDLDKNGDGSLSRDEAAGNPWLAQHFKEADDNGDGKLTRVEYLKRMVVKDFNAVREKTADLIEPGKQGSSSTGSSKK